VSFIPEDPPGVMSSISVSIMQDDHTITMSRILIAESVVGVVLSDPDAASIVKVESNGLLNVRFAGKQADLKSVRQVKQGGHVFRRGRSLTRLLTIAGQWKLVCDAVMSRWQDCQQTDTESNEAEQAQT